MGRVSAGARRRARVIILLTLVVGALAVVPGGAQEPPTIPEEIPLPERVPVVGPVVDTVFDAAAPILENETGEDLRNEQIDVEIEIDMRNIDFSMLGILFGGGKIEADLRASLSLNFYALSVERLDQALQASTGDANMSLNKTFGVDTQRKVITAEEVRLLGGGILLEAFQELQESATRDLIQSALPGLIVLQSDFEWSNTLPVTDVRNGVPALPLRDPPIHLEASVVMHYLERVSAFDMVSSARANAKEAAANNTTADPAEDEADRLKNSIEENQTLPPMERNAFMFLGYGQLLDLSAPPGWRLDITMIVPRGFTIEQASEEFVVDGEQRGAEYSVTGDRLETASTAGVVTVSNRFVVTTALFGVFIVAAVLARTLVEAVVFTGHRALAAQARKRTDASASERGTGAES